MPPDGHGTDPVHVDAARRHGRLGERGGRRGAGRYRVRAVDANGDAAEAVVDVGARYEDAVHVRQYRARHATTSTSRDGSVEALGDGFDTPGLRFLWSNGVVTDAPRLSDVPARDVRARRDPRRRGRPDDHPRVRARARGRSPVGPVLEKKK